MQKNIIAKYLVCLCLLAHDIGFTTHLQAQEYQPWLSSWNRIIGKEAILPTFTPADTARIMQMIAIGKTLETTQPDSALSLLQAVKRESRNIGFTDGIASALFNIGRVLTQTGKTDSALHIYRIALPYCRKVNYFKYLTPAVYHNIGAIHTYIGQYQKAIQYYDSALLEGDNAHLPEDRQHVVNTYINLGSIHIKLQQYHLALPYIEKAEQISRRKNYMEQLAMALQNKGEVYRHLKQYDKAETYYKESLMIANQYNYANTRQIIYMCIAEMLLTEGKVVEAARYWDKIEEANDIQNTVHNTSLPNRAIGKNYLLIKNYPKAEMHLLRALKYATELGLENDKMDIHEALTILYEETARPAQALQQLKIYQQLKDSIFNKEKVKDINELDIKYRSAEKDKQILLQKAAGRNKDIWIGITTGTGTILLITLLFLYRQKRQEQAITQMKALIKGEEQERNRIAQELHDGIGSMLAAIKMGVSHLKSRPDSDQPYDQLMGIVEATALEVRRTAHNLIPTVLERNSLEEALQQYCTSLSRKAGLQIEVHFNGSIEGLDKRGALVIYRIVQELLQNVVKHADASLADVQITRQGDKLNIIVEDNGIGFDNEDEGDGIGLQNLRQRVQALNGYLSINSIKGRNTTVFIKFDIRKLADLV